MFETLVTLKFKANTPTNLEKAFDKAFVGVLLALLANKLATKLIYESILTISPICFNILNRKI